MVAINNLSPPQIVFMSDDADISDRNRFGSSAFVSSRIAFVIVAAYHNIEEENR